MLGRRVFQNGTVKREGRIYSRALLNSRKTNVGARTVVVKPRPKRQLLLHCSFRDRVNQSPVCLTVESNADNTELPSVMRLDCTSSRRNSVTAFFSTNEGGRNFRSRR